MHQTIDGKMVFLALKGASLILAVGFAACAPQVPAGSGYRPVSQEMLVGAKLHHPTGGDDGKLDWVFSAQEFVITTEGDSLPPGLVEALTGELPVAKKITGTWDLQDEVMTISNVKIDDTIEVAGKRTLRTFFTGVIRIQIPGVQYVFSHQVD